MKRYIQTLLFLVCSIHSYSQDDNRWFIEKANGDVGFIDSLGHEIFTGKYEWLSEHYSCGLVPFKKDSEYGYLDIKGTKVFKTSKIGDWFSENLLPVEEAGVFYYLNTKGQRAIELSNLEIPEGKEIYKIHNFHSGLALVIVKSLDSCDYLYGFINKSGQWFIKPTLRNATSFIEGVSYVATETNCFFMNNKGNMIATIDCEKDGIAQEIDSDLFDYAEGFALIYKTDSAIFINRNGKRICSHMFQRASNFSDGMAAIQLNDKWGFCDTTGNIIIQPQYEVPSDFSEGLAPVYLDIKAEGYVFNTINTQGFIDKTGKTVIPFQPNVSFAGFKNGLTQGKRFIYKNKRYTGKYELFYMRKDGKKVWSEIVKQ